ncbi:MAG: 3-deoxy-7-phosphoheptulonate synthase [Gammaproteobacteria bacterium]|nr:3-deoxy-7-phosphoheptulonate synthase [Gammaproteobacteria bacterium]
MKYLTDDLRIVALKELLAPEDVHQKHPITESAAKLILDTRQQEHNILTGKDDRLIVIVGPCSIHDPEAALEYATRLKKVSETLKDDLLIIMRVYFEKPRTRVGWKGLINDPELDGSFHINKGLNLARKLLLDLNEIGVPAATEYLDLISPQYIADLISWGAIGARTTESQAHRELASGLSCPVGFKNGTDGNLNIAVDAICSASQPHNFLSVTKAGCSAIFATTGNDDCHIILRGGNSAPNYDTESVNLASQTLKNAGLRENIMIDLSHANSNKQPEKQTQVGNHVAKQIADGDPRIIGVMIESHLIGGRQNIVDGKAPTYGQSITDGCLSWDNSVPLLKKLAASVQQRRKK